MVVLGSGAERAIQDVALTRYACYLLAQNGDPRKEAIAFAQSYFAVQTRRQEILEARLIEQERVHARHRLVESEKEMGVRGIKPEQLPSAGDVKKVERRLAAEARKLPRVAKAIARHGRKPGS